MIFVVASIGVAPPLARGADLFDNAYVKASNTELGDRFGTSVAIFDDALVVGAPYEDSSGTGVDPDAQADNGAPYRGAVYIYARRNGVWEQQAYIKPPSGAPVAFFGEAVAISGDTLVVGARWNDAPLQNSGAVFVFERQDGVWTEQAYLKAPNADSSDEFGYSLDISGDTLIVGAPYEDGNGRGVNPAAQADNSAPYSGAAYVFMRTNDVWSFQAYLKASNAEGGDQFGWRVAVSGDTALVTARFEDGSGKGVNPGMEGDNLAELAGAAYVFYRSGGVWRQQAYLKASNADPGDRFGFHAALDGDTAVIVAPGEASSGTGVDPDAQLDNSAPHSGAAYVFVRRGGAWGAEAYLKSPPNAISLGSTIGLSGDVLVSRTSNYPDNPAVQVYRRSNGMWSIGDRLLAAGGDPRDYFGGAAATDAASVVVGAPWEWGSGTGINPPKDGKAPDAGAAYVFDDVVSTCAEPSAVGRFRNGGL